MRIWSVVSSNWVTSGFWWLLILVLYLLLNLDISSLIIGILMSRCIVSLVTYQGASIKDLKVFDWNRWRNSMLELLAVPHNWFPKSWNHYFVVATVWIGALYRWKIVSLSIISVMKGNISPCNISWHPTTFD